LILKTLITMNSSTLPTVTNAMRLLMIAEIREIQQALETVVRDPVLRNRLYGHVLPAMLEFLSAVRLMPVERYDVPSLQELVVFARQLRLHTVWEDSQIEDEDEDEVEDEDEDEDEDAPSMFDGDEETLDSDETRSEEEDPTESDMEFIDDSELILDNPAPQLMGGWTREEMDLALSDLGCSMMGLSEAEPAPPVLVRQATQRSFLPPPARSQMSRARAVVTPPPPQRNAAAGTREDPVDLTL
jgi:hypothetical protein